MRLKTKVFFRRIPLLGKLLPEISFGERLSGICDFLGKDFSWKVEREEGDTGFWRCSVSGKDLILSKCWAFGDRREAEKELFKRTVSMMDPRSLEKGGIVERIFPEMDFQWNLLERVSRGKFFLGKASGEHLLWWTVPDDLPSGSDDGRGTVLFRSNSSEEHVKMDALEKIREILGVSCDEELSMFMEGIGN